MKTKKPRLRMLMQAFLRARGIACDGLTYGPLKVAALRALNIDTEAPPRNKDLRILIAGNLTPKRATFYDSDEWRTLRYRALKQHGGCCQCCGARAAPGKPLHVDHIKPRSKFQELQLELSNLQVLCKDCNLGKRAWDETDWRAA